MTKGGRGWTNTRRGQAEADTAINSMLDRPQAGEQVQHIEDSLIEDSPYQARRPFSAADVEELAQAMRETGFQGVLIVRPHSDSEKRRRGMVQLAYGHRRRLAWRQICQERGMACVLPVVQRDLDDAQLLTIGAQENLQRQDLDPLEEAQLVAWHERVFYPKGQAEIATMLGKSVDWVKTRSRIHKLPDVLKDRLRQRPQAVSHFVELGVFYAQNPDVALMLADQVVAGQLTVEALRTAIRGTAAVHPRDREESHEQRDIALIVQDVTNVEGRVDQADARTPGSRGQSPAAAGEEVSETVRRHRSHRAGSATDLPQPPAPAGALALLEAAAQSLQVLASAPHDLAPSALPLLEQSFVALRMLQAAIIQQSLSTRSMAPPAEYRLADSAMPTLIARLAAGDLVPMRLEAPDGSFPGEILWVMLAGSTFDQIMVATMASCGVLPITEDLTAAQVGAILTAPPGTVDLLAAFVHDLAHVRRQLIAGA